MNEDQPLFLNIATELARARRLSAPKFVGKGAFKETFRVQTETGDVVALKILDPDETNVERSDREIDAMQRCDCSHIARLIEFGTFASRSGEQFSFLLEEYFDGGTLASRCEIDTISTPDVKTYGIVIANALEHLRKLRLVHRDIKPENVMFRNGSNDPVLVDFGLVRDLSKVSLTKTFLPRGPGSPYYSSPEQLNNDKALIDWRSDQFSLAVTLGEVLTRQHPFAGRNVGETLAKVAGRELCNDSFVAAAENANLLALVRMLEPWPVNRYQTPSALIEALRG